MKRIERKIEKFKQISKGNVRKIGLEIIDELINLNFQLGEEAEIVSKQNDKLLKVSKDLKKEHKRIMKIFHQKKPKY